MARLLAKPELLAPAGDEESLKAAVAAGADAVYFGLRGGFNARARADNFSADELPRVFDYLHARGVQGFVTFNTLVFDK
jgi:putative protease